MLIYDTITFKGNEYPMYEIRHPQTKQDILVGTEELGDLLLAVMERDGYTKEEKREAENIDEKFYCFMPSSVLEGNEEEVIKYFSIYFD